MTTLSIKIFRTDQTLLIDLKWFLHYQWFQIGSNNFIRFKTNKFISKLTFMDFSRNEAGSLWGSFTMQQRATDFGATKNIKKEQFHFET